MHRRVWFAILAGAAGGSVAIGLMEYFATRNTMPVMAVPFATSIVLVLGSPEVEAAQPSIRPLRPPHSRAGASSAGSMTP